jgi:hypothetical protein
LLFQGHYQNAYVTHDIDRAADWFTRRFGVEDYLRYDSDMTVETPQGTEPLQLRVAMVWSGHLQLEVIQPLGGCVEFYRDFLPRDRADFVPRFHHVAVRRDRPEGMREEFVRRDMPFVLEGEVPGLVFGYADARVACGHYIEYCWATEENWAANGWPAGKPVN